MNGFLLLAPFLLIRFTLLSYFGKEAVARAAKFSTMLGKEVIAYWVYQLSNITIFIYLIFLKVIFDNSWIFYIGLCCYVIGAILCVFSIIHFARPADNGFNGNGIYQFSRNPMYVSYFLFFVGCVFLTQSFLLGGIVIVFQISAHWIILSEEKWCIQKFGNLYKEYMKNVRRYI